jgi:beta-phosphoglucomutase
MTRAVFFDLDGTLIDSMPAHVSAWSKILQDEGIPVDGRYIRLHEGEKAETTIAQLAHDHGRALSETELHDLIERKRTLYRTMAPRGIIPAARKLVETLREKRIECDIVTGSIRRNLEGVVSADEQALFTHIIAADDYEKGKPSPDPYLMAIKISGFAPEECIAFENAPLGIRSALAARLRTVAITTTLAPDDLQIPGCRVISRYEEFLNCL